MTASDTTTLDGFFSFATAGAQGTFTISLFFGGQILQFQAVMTVANKAHQQVSGAGTATLAVPPASLPNTSSSVRVTPAPSLTATIGTVCTFNGAPWTNVGFMAEGGWALQPPEPGSVLCAGMNASGVWSGPAQIPYDGGPLQTAGMNAPIVQTQGNLILFQRGAGAETDIYAWLFVPPHTLEGGQAVPDAYSTVGWIGAATFNGDLYMAWRGLTPDNTVWWSTLPGETWTPPSAITGAFTDIGPSLVSYNNFLYCVWKGEDGDQALWYAALDSAGTWSQPAKIPQAFTSTGAVSLAVFDGLLYVVWRGAAPDISIRYAYMSAGGIWSGASAIPGAYSSVGPALATFGGQLYAAWTGAPGDKQIWLASINTAGAWSAPVVVPGALTSQNPSLAVLNDVLYMTWIA